MRRCACFAISVLSMFCDIAIAQDLSQVESPEPRVGDNRVYAVLEPISRAEQRTSDLTVTEVTDKQIQVTDKTSSHIAIYDRNWALEQAGNRKYSPPVQAVSFPMQPGKTWEHTNTYTHASCGATTSELKNEVIGWEDVTVLAGTFRALRIDSAGYWRNRCGSDRSQYKFWYVPAVKWFVKSESLIYAGGRIYDGHILELKSYKVE